MTEFIIYWFLFNLSLILLVTWIAFRTRFKWYRKWRGGTWFLIVDEFILDTETDDREQVITRWTQGEVRKDLILKTEYYG